MIFRKIYRFNAAELVSSPSKVVPLSFTPKVIRHEETHSRDIRKFFDLVISQVISVD